MVTAAIATQAKFPQVPGYRLTDQLYVGSRTAVYRALQLETQQSVVIKLLQQAYPSFSDLVRFRNQYAVTQNLTLPGVVRTLQLASWQHSQALVMEDFGGISLQQYVKQQAGPGRALPLADVLAIALQMAGILHGLYQQHIIHKDIKPANILIHPKSKQIKLIDFSIASCLPKENQTLQNPNGLEGSLLYLAPEQTGRMNRGIDYRADFYGLGVSLYELLTGELPFQADEPLALVHCHIARQPPAPQAINPSIPPVVSDIVLKLMAKNAEDRYQSALGLKADLARCLSQWQATGEIVPFELCAEDVSDYFLIPEKLYGRETEIQTLLASFERAAKGCCELTLVAGLSGIGKTALINEVHKPITRQRGYFIKGKFDQFNRNIPLLAFVQALRDLIGQLLSESDQRIAQWRDVILAAVGENGQILIEVIPELEQIIGSQPAAPELSGTAAENRFKRLFQNFIGVFTQIEHPLTIFLDDLQWADTGSLQLIELLAGQSQHLLLLGAYRDNEVSPTHGLTRMVADLQESTVPVSTITLVPLAVKDANQLVAETLHCRPEQAESLTTLLLRKTQGNPFFTVQFLKSLYEDGHISFDADQGYWEYDITQVSALALTDDVVALMAQQLQKLSIETQQVLQLAACIGNQFDLSTLAVVSKRSQSEVAKALWKALKAGLILPINQVYKLFQGEDLPAEALTVDPLKKDAVSLSSESLSSESLSTDENTTDTTYRFLHDRVQQAAYSLIPDSEKQITHLKIGRLLLANMAVAEQEDNLFSIVSQMNLGSLQINDFAERQTLCNLNLTAAQKAKSAAAYSASADFLKIAIQLLEQSSQASLGSALSEQTSPIQDTTEFDTPKNHTPNNHAWKFDYALALQLHNLLAEASCLSGDFDGAAQQIAVTLEQANTTLDRVFAYEIRMQLFIAQNQFQLALDTGLEVLSLLNVTFQETTPPELDIERLYHLPTTSDPQAIAALSVLSKLWAPAFISKPELLPKVTLTMLALTATYGNSVPGAFAYALYGMQLCGTAQDIELGYRFGKLALRTLERYETTDLTCKVKQLFHAFIRNWKEPAHKGVEALADNVQTGLETGDIEFACYSAMNYCDNLCIMGIPLRTIQPKQRYYSELTQTVQQDIPHDCILIWGQFLDNLTGQTDSPTQLVGEWFDEQTQLAKLKATNAFSALFFVSIAKMILGYLFGDYEGARVQAEAIAQYEAAGYGLLPITQLPFYKSLALLALYNRATPEQQTANLTEIKIHQGRLAVWAAHAPENFQHKVDLVAAEIARVQQQPAVALELYDRAIAGAQANGYTHEEAIANELAAKFYLEWGRSSGVHSKEKIAAAYLQEAYYSYMRWEAKAKTDELEQRYPQLLQPILQEATAEQNPMAILGTIAAIDRSHQASSHTSTTTTYASTTSSNTALDFAAVIKTAQSLSSTIELDELARQLTRIILQNSGGDRCALILQNEADAWCVEAAATLTASELASGPIDEQTDLPVKLLHYVKNTQSVVLIDQLKTDLPVIDRYLLQQQPQSVLCLPILNQGQVIGILYLENTSTSHVFTRDRIFTLNFLCTQAAISIENARLYRQAQDYAQQIEQSQLQTVQSEKMASLGNLVAGVAHEINNPIGFLHGSINNANTHLQDILTHLELYQTHYPSPAEPIQEDAEDVDIAFLCQDLPKILASMKGATQRIKNISTSLRTFSRADTEHKISANLNEGLDSTLLILKYRLKGNDQRPTIEVIKDYDDLPAIQCFPGRLNQVFMNLLANAIDMFDEVASQSSFEQLKHQPAQKIIVKTSLSTGKNAIEIRMRDNGKGMTQDVKAKIFDHLFTTKAVGKGTGLGLAIARQIITEAHGGDLSVSSELGQGTEFCIWLPIE